jgi:hypothetical protein
MGERIGDTCFWWGNLRKRDHLEDPGVDRRIILKCISGSGLGIWTGLIWFRTGTVGVLFLNTVMNVWVV